METKVMTLTDFAPRTAFAVIEVYPLAARLRFKGSRVRITDDGEVWQDYRVARVSYPDEFGLCTLTLEPSEPDS